jgi:adenylate cyclase
MSAARIVHQPPTGGPVDVPLERPVTIGRGADCTVTLHDDLASRMHARVTAEGTGALLVDLGSTNGTTVEGVRINRRVLADGDTFVVGRSKFTLRIAPASARVPDAPGAAPTTARLPPDLARKGTGLVLTDAPQNSVYEARAGLSLDEESVGTNTQSLSMSQMAGLSKKLAALNKIGNALASILEVDALLAEVTQAVLGLFPRADRCCVLLDEKGELRPARVENRSKAQEVGEIRLSRTVLALNRDERKGVLSFDTATDQRLSAAVSIVASGIRSVMSVPIVLKDEFYGILYVDSGNIGAPFTSEDLQLLASLAGQVGIFVKNARLVGQIERETELRTNLGRYLSPSVVAEIARGALMPSLGGETREGTCLFSDIVGFTRICRNLDAAEVVALLNRFFREMVDAVFHWEGTVDKFGGDAMLCVWGAPVVLPDHATPAVAAALEMQVRLFGFNLDLAAQDHPVLVRMGIGLNSGSFIAGNVGSERRLEYTVIGDDVNLAQRTEEKASGGQVLVTEATRLKSPSLAAVRLKPITIRGASHEFTLHAVAGVPKPGSKGNTLLMATPAVAGPPGGPFVESIVTALERRQEGLVLVLRVPTSACDATMAALEVRLQRPEIPGLQPIVGGIMEMRAPGAGCRWREVEVLVPFLPEPLDDVLRPGGTWDSPLSPDDIPRSAPVA